MRVAILGTGGVGLSYAALLHTNGHEPVLWSPSGRGIEPFRNGQVLEAHGAVRTTFSPLHATDIGDAVSGADVVILAVPAEAMRSVMDDVAPHLTDLHHVIISSHYSYAAFYLLERLGRNGCCPMISGWATTVAAGKRTSGTRVDIQYVRTLIDVGTIPAIRGAEGLASCEVLFGKHFRLRENFLSIALSNMNPHVHMALILGNLTRIERAEGWRIYSGFTPGLANMLQALDDERLALARAAKVDVRTLKEHFALTHSVPEQRLDLMCAQMHDIGRGSPAPTSIDTEYIIEDVPYGLWPIVLLAKKFGVPTPLHQAGIEIFNAIHGEGLHLRNDLLNAVRFQELTAKELLDALTNGTLPQQRTPAAVGTD